MTISKSELDQWHELIDALAVGELQMKVGDTWAATETLYTGLGDSSYRRKPKPKEWWMNVYPNSAIGYAHPTKEMADNSRGHSKGRTVRVREIID